MEPARAKKRTAASRAENTAIRIPLRSPPRRVAARPLVPARRSGPTAKASCSRVAWPVTSPAAAGRRSTDRRQHAGSAPVYGGAARSRSASRPGGGGVLLAASRSVRSPAVPGRQLLRRDPIRRRNVPSLPHPKLPLLPAHTRADAPPTSLSRPVTIHLKVLCFPCRNQQSLTCTPPEPCRSLPEDLSPDRRIALAAVPGANEVLPPVERPAPAAFRRLDRVGEEPSVEVLPRPGR